MALRPTYTQAQLAAPIRNHTSLELSAMSAVDFAQMVRLRSAQRLFQAGQAAGTNVHSTANIAAANRMRRSPGKSPSIAV